jgi:amidase
MRIPSGARVAKPIRCSLALGVNSTRSRFRSAIGPSSGTRSIVSNARTPGAAAHSRISVSKILGFFQNYDVLLTPTLGKPPPRLGALVPQGLEALGQKAIVALKARVALNIPGAVRSAVSRVYEFIPFTPIANVTGQPAMSLPLHWNEAGLPIGTMFTGRFGDEATLFRLAGQLERERPWFDKRPPGFGA